MLCLWAGAPFVVVCNHANIPNLSLNKVVAPNEMGLKPPNVAKGVRDFGP